MSRSPSRSTRGAARPRFAMPPRGALREALVVEVRVFRGVVDDAPPREPPRGPVGGAISKVAVGWVCSRSKVAPVRRGRVANEARDPVVRKECGGTRKMWRRSFTIEADKELARWLAVNRARFVGDEAELYSTPRPSRTGRKERKLQPVKKMEIRGSQMRILVVKDPLGYCCCC